MEKRSGYKAKKIEREKNRSLVQKSLILFRNIGPQNGYIASGVRQPNRVLSNSFP